jgi:hypothetical protein
VAAEQEDERPADAIVERVEREDGRYLLYFSWPETLPSPQAKPPVATADE